MADYQLAIGTLTLGAGTKYQLRGGPEGLGLPDLRTSDTPRPQDHGLFWGSDYFGKRTLTLDVTILGDDPGDAAAKMDALAAVWQPPAGSEATVPLTLDLPGQVARTLDGRPRRAAYNLDNLKAGIIVATLQYEAADPRLYSAETVLSTAAATTGGGRTYNRVYPLVYAAGGTGGTLLATNLGNVPSRPVLRVNGPSNTPRIENITAGKVLAANLTVAAGEFLEFDLDAHTVLLNGTASRYGSLVAGSSWWEIAPGANSIRFTSADSAGTLDVHFRSAWL
jgi:hypothetical protein